MDYIIHHTCTPSHAPSSPPPPLPLETSLIMAVIKVTRWTPRGLMSQLVPHLFRRPRHAQEMIPGDPRSQNVPLDASDCNYFLKRKKERFVKDLKSKYRSQTPHPDVSRLVKGCCWCVATGEWHAVGTSQLVPTLCFPPSLGRTVMEHIIHVDNPWITANGLLLPKPMSEAFDDWAVTIVPANHKDIPVQWNHTSYIMRIMDPNHPQLSKPLYDGPGQNSRVLVGDLDGKEMIFMRYTRPFHRYLFYHACCCVWKKEYLANPQYNDPAEFWHRFMKRISTLWPGWYVKRSFITPVFNPQQAQELKEITGAWGRSGVERKGLFQDGEFVTKLEAKLEEKLEDLSSMQCSF